MGRAVGDVPGLVESALTSASYARELGMNPDNIIISCKVSGVRDLVAVYRELARRCDYPLHLGLTEAAWAPRARWRRAWRSVCCCRKALATPSASRLTPQPGESRTQEVVIASEILQSLGLRHFNPSVTACPGCGRTTEHHLPGTGQADRRLPAGANARLGAKYPGVEGLKVAVMGCIVNGPGEQARRHRHQPARHR